MTNSNQKERFQTKIAMLEQNNQVLQNKCEEYLGELIRTRKALDVAKKWLMKIGYLDMTEHGLGSENMMTDWCKTVALHGLKEIETALEQKDK